MNIMVLDFDDKFVEYDWNTKEEFLADMRSGKREGVYMPELSEAVITADTANESYGEMVLKLEYGIWTVEDLVEAVEKGFI